MNQKTLGIISYLWWFGLLLAMFNNRQKTEYIRFHIRQSFGLLFLSFLNLLLYYLHKPIAELLMLAVGILLFVLWIIAIMGALKEEKKPIPVFGELFQKWFRNL